MNKKYIEWLLSTYALVPCILLFAISILFMAGAAIQADDFNREMSQVEKLLFISPAVPLLWFVSIVLARIFMLNEPKPIGGLKKNTIWLTLGLIIPVSILLMFIL